MTFEQFRDSGRDCKDIGAALRDDVLIGSLGRLYCDDCLYIEDTSGPGWTRVGPIGRWYTLIGRAEFDSDDLAVIERKLYEFARSEGYEVY
jgi:hypothetical protein